MTENKKSIVEEALLDLKIITEALEANTKEILRSVAIGEIDSVVKESINEDMYDETDVEDTDDEANAEAPVDGDDFGGDDLGASVDNEVPAAPAADGLDNEIGGLDLGAQAGEDLGAEEGGDDYEFDLTGASDEDVISVYKKLASDDEIEVISPNEVIIKDPTSGAEYNVKLGSSGAAPAAPAGGMDLDLGLGDDITGDAAPEVELEPSAAPVGEPSTDVPAEAPEAPAAPATDDAPADTDSEDEEDDDELGESVVFEIALGDLEEGEEELAEDIIRGKGHDTHLTTTTMDSGNIEGTKADKDADSGDNLVGGFDDDAVSHANAEGPMVMGENDDLENNTSNEDAYGKAFDSMEIDEAIPVGNAQGRRLPGKETPIKGAGAKSLEEANKRYDALLKEARKLQYESDELKKIVKTFRNKLGEAVVFNENLAHVVRLFQEHSTTASEKNQIVKRFDSQATTLAESKRLYKVIASELGSKKPLAESIGDKNVLGTSSTAGHLNESTAYVHPETKRIQDLMRRVENR